MNKSCLLTLALLLGGCSVVGLPSTPGEQASGYGYVPLDGLAVKQTRFDPSCQLAKSDWSPLLQALPDLSVRFSVADFEASGALSFGPSKITASDQTYRAVLDYVNVDSIPENFFVREYIESSSGGEAVPTNIRTVLRPGDKVVAFEAVIASDDSTVGPSKGVQIQAMAPERRAQEGWDQVTIPVYVGIGMRLSADVTALKGGITLSSLGAIGAEAEAGNLTGTLTVQTLGINGKSIATALPMPSKLDQTTIENGILALGTSRAVLYAGGNTDSGGDVTKTPRVVGLYSPIGTSPLLINAIYSELSKQRPQWARPCNPPPT